jgi:hypothetical protein
MSALTGAKRLIYCVDTMAFGLREYLRFRCGLPIFRENIAAWVGYFSRKGIAKQ